jgi:hypothetical protein
LTTTPIAGKVASLDTSFSNRLKAKSLARAAMATSNIVGSTNMSITGNITIPANSGYYMVNTGIGAMAQNQNIIGSINPNFTTYTTSISTLPSVGILDLYDTNNKEIVRLNKDGSVTWANGIEVDEAADAFARSIGQGAERSAGITYGVKQRMRDAVFEELIDMAKSKGSLTADDLTYLHQSAKIMDKLKGIK